MVDSIGRGRSSTRRSSSKPVRFNDDDDDHDDGDNGDTAIGNTSFFAAIAAKKETKNNSNKKKSPSQDPVSKTSNTAVKTKPKKRGGSRGGHNEDDDDNDEQEEEEETEMRASPARTSSRRIRITIGNSVVSPPTNNAKNYNKRKRDSSKEAKYEVGDVVEVLYEDGDSDEADWYEATILKKKVYHGDIRLVNMIHSIPQHSM